MHDGALKVGWHERLGCCLCRFLYQNRLVALLLLLVAPRRRRPRGVLVSFLLAFRVPCLAAACGLAVALLLLCFACLPFLLLPFCRLLHIPVRKPVTITADTRLALSSSSYMA